MNTAELSVSLGHCAFFSLHLLGLSYCLVKRSDIAECFFGHLIAFAAQNRLKAGNRVFQLHVTTLQACKLLSNEERLGKEALNLPCALHSQLVLIRKLIHTQNVDDVLQVLV